MVLGRDLCDGYRFCYTRGKEKTLDYFIDDSVLSAWPGDRVGS